MKTEIIDGIKVQVIENEQDMLEYIKSVPIAFNINCNDKIITSVNGFDLYYPGEEESFRKIVPQTVAIGR